MRRRVHILAALFAAGCCTAGAAERLARHIADIPGMPAGIFDVAQDSTGYLWLAGAEGLSRYDGIEVRDWGRDVSRGVLHWVAAGPGDRVVCGSRRSGLFEVDGLGLRRVDPPQGAASPGPHDAVYDRHGTLWAAWDGHLWRREGSAWTSALPAGTEAGTFAELSPRRDGGVLAGTLDGAIWLVEPDGRAVAIATDLGGWVTQLAEDENRNALAVVRLGPRPGVIRVGPDGVSWLLDYAGRAEGLARHRETLWVSYGTGVFALHDDGRREFLTPREGFAGNGEIEIDREGGLWVASARTLSHYPQPETLYWTELSGLPRTYLRRVHRVGDVLLVASWHGPMLFDPRSGTARDLDLGGRFSRDPGCADPWGGVWLKTFRIPHSGHVDGARPDRAVVGVWRDGRFDVIVERAWFRGDLACDTSARSGVWFLLGSELMNVAARGAAPRLRAHLPAEVASRLQADLEIVDDGREVIAAWASGEVCTLAGLREDRAADPDRWSCERVPGADAVTRVERTPWGTVWLASPDAGVFERMEDGAWRRVPGELAELPGALALDRAPSGGMWVLGWRERLRVDVMRDGEPPQVVERLSVAQGVPSWMNSRYLLEEDDGTVWLPLFSGLVRVPIQARRAQVPTPTVSITHLVADGHEVAPGDRFALRHGDHSLEVHWSALSYSDPTRIRYRMRVDSDPHWTVLGQPFVRLAGFAPGRHRVEFGASLDGRTWSVSPAVVTFRVQQAWYLRGWFLTLVAVSLAGVVYGIYRARVAHLLRLERQRTRIAMDLHDDLGAGLGSAGLLVGLLGEADLDPGERERLVVRAGRLLRDLGSSLTDIVWSLRPGSDTLAELVLFLRQRAGDMFPQDGATRVEIVAPDPCPPVHLDLPLRRNLQWITVEAMHNAARHAGARRVVVALERDGDEWLLSVRDDGCGFEAAENGDGGHGLGQQSMRRRAREIGARLEVRSSPGEGTTVELRFRTRGRRS